MAQSDPKQFKLTKNSIKDLQSILSYISTNATGYRTSLLSRGELVQSYLEKSSDRTADTLKGRIANQAGDKSKIGNLEVPILKIQRETACAYLAGAFLSGTPIFAATATRDKEDIAEMLTALTGRDQDMFNWIASLQQVHEDVLTHPVCATEVYWANKKTTTVGQALNSKGEMTGIAQVTAYTGNNIKRIDPYNLIIDTGVPPHEVHTRGTFAGYVERMSYVAFKEMYDGLEDIYTVKINREAIFKDAAPNASVMQGTVTTQLYKYPTIHRSRVSGETANERVYDWGSFWGGNNTAKQMTTNLTQGGYEVVRLYIRISLKDFGYETADTGIHVCLLIYVNGLLAYVEPMLNSHGMFPLVVGQFYSGDVNTTTFCEYLIDVQDLSTSLMTGALNSMRRAVSDRALYDPSRISDAAMQSVNPANKIAVRMNTYQSNFDNAYKQIPYEDRISGNMVQMMNMVSSIGDKVTGQNPASQGNFVKGNKTREEFDTVMSNSQARMQLGALYLEQHFYAAVKQIIRANYLLYAQSEEINSAGTDKVVPVDAAKLREEAPSFKMAGGLVPVTKMAATDVLLMAFQAMSMNPLLAIEYDTGGMLVSALKQQGLMGLDQYKRAPEEQQRMAALQQPPKEPAAPAQE